MTAKYDRCSLCNEKQFKTTVLVSEPVTLSTGRQVCVKCYKQVIDNYKFYKLLVAQSSSFIDQFLHRI